MNVTLGLTKHRRFLLAQRPTILQEEHSAIWNYSGAVVIGDHDAQAGDIVHPIHFASTDVETDAELIVAGHERDALDIADENLLSDFFGVPAIGFVSGVGGADALSRGLIDGHGAIETEAGLLESEVNDGAKRSAGTQF